MFKFYYNICNDIKSKLTEYFLWCRVSPCLLLLLPRGERNYHDGQTTLRRLTEDFSIVVRNQFVYIRPVPLCLYFIIVQEERAERTLKSMGLVNKTLIDGGWIYEGWANINKQEDGELLCTRKRNDKGGKEVRSYITNLNRTKGRGERVAIKREIVAMN